MYCLLFVCVTTGALWATSVALEPKIVGPAQAPITDEVIIQVYGADVWGFRGNFAIHTWIATKEKAAATYTIYQVIGWRLRRNGTAGSITQGMPDKPWFRSLPLLLHTNCAVPKRSNSSIKWPRRRARTLCQGICNVARTQQQFVYRMDRARSAPIGFAVAHKSDRQAVDAGRVPAIAALAHGGFMHRSPTPS